MSASRHAKAQRQRHQAVRCRRLQRRVGDTPRDARRSARATQRRGQARPRTSRRVAPSRSRRPSATARSACPTAAAPSPVTMASSAPPTPAAPASAAAAAVVDASRGARRFEQPRRDARTGPRPSASAASPISASAPASAVVAGQRTAPGRPTRARAVCQPSWRRNDALVLSASDAAGRTATCADVVQFGSALPYRPCPPAATARSHRSWRRRRRQRPAAGCAPNARRPRCSSTARINSAQIGPREPDTAVQARMLPTHWLTVCGRHVNGHVNCLLSARKDRNDTRVTPNSGNARSTCGRNAISHHVAVAARSL